MASPAFRDIAWAVLGLYRRIGVATLTFQGHLTSSVTVTWPFDSP